MRWLTSNTTFSILISHNCSGTEPTLVSTTNGLSSLSLHWFCYSSLQGYYTLGRVWGMVALMRAEWLLLSHAWSLRSHIQRILSHAWNIRLHALTSRRLQVLLSYDWRYTSTHIPRLIPFILPDGSFLLISRPKHLPTVISYDSRLSSLAWYLLSQACLLLSHAWYF